MNGLDEDFQTVVEVDFVYVARRAGDGRGFRNRHGVHYTGRFTAIFPSGNPEILEVLPDPAMF
jgi:hypothetical protein